MSSLVNNQTRQNMQSDGPSFQGPQHFTEYAPWKITSLCPEVKIFRNCIFCGEERYDDRQWESLEDRIQYGDDAIVCDKTQCFKAWSSYTSALKKNNKYSQFKNKRMVSRQFIKSVQSPSLLGEWSSSEYTGLSHNPRVHE